MSDDPWDAIVETEGDEPPPIEPESPSPEHVLFVVMGALAMVLVIAQLMGLF